MATRSTIALEYLDGSICQIYCHFDGYLDGNGLCLQEHYSDPFKLHELMHLGDMSSLGRYIESNQDFPDRDVNVCVFYGRDRGETDTQARLFKDFEDYLANFQDEDFNYILRQIDGVPVWYVSHYDSNGKFEKLQFAYKRQSVESLK